MCDNRGVDCLLHFLYIWTDPYCGASGTHSTSSTKFVIFSAQLILPGFQNSSLFQEPAFYHLTAKKNVCHNGCFCIPSIKSDSVRWVYAVAMSSVKMFMSRFSCVCGCRSPGTSATSSIVLMANQHLCPAPSLQKAIRVRGHISFPSMSCRRWYRRPWEKDQFNYPCHIHGYTCITNTLTR